MKLWQKKKTFSEKVLPLYTEFDKREHVARVGAMVLATTTDYPEECLRVALCHDLIEDEYATWGQLTQLGLSFEEVEAVGLLTRLENQTYKHYISDIIAARDTIPGQFALTVKTCDIADHLHYPRILNLSRKKAQRYLDAYTELADALTT